MIWIKAPHFTAGALYKDGVVYDAAPILKRWMIGRSIDWVVQHCQTKGYKYAIQIG